jgi:hypothetical protein
VIKELYNRGQGSSWTVAPIEREKTPDMHLSYRDIFLRPRRWKAFTWMCWKTSLLQNRKNKMRKCPDKMVQAPLSVIFQLVSGCPKRNHGSISYPPSSLDLTPFDVLLRDYITSAFSGNAGHVGCVHTLKHKIMENH